MIIFRVVIGFITKINSFLQNIQAFSKINNLKNYFFYRIKNKFLNDSQSSFLQLKECMGIVIKLLKSDGDIEFLSHFNDQANDTGFT